MRLTHFIQEDPDMKRLLAAVLSFCLLLTPLAALAEGFAPSSLVFSALTRQLKHIMNGNPRNFNWVLESPDGAVYSAAHSTDTNGSILRFESPDAALTATSGNLYLTDTSGTSSVAVEALIDHLLPQLEPLIALTGENPAALLPALEELLLRCTASNGFSFVLTENLFTLHVDVDQFLNDLYHAVPAVLLAHADVLDPLLTKYLPQLTGQSFTCWQLGMLWTKHLPFLQTDTGLTLDLTGYLHGDRASLLGNIAGCSFDATVSSTAFSFSFTPAWEDMTYSFSTDDVLTLLTLLSSIPGSLSSEAVNISYSTNKDTIISHIRVDTQRLSAELNQQLAKIVRDNWRTVSTLLTKYGPWMELFEVPYTTTQSLADELEDGVIDLGDRPISIDFTRGTLTHVYTLNGSIGTTSFSFSIAGLQDGTLAQGSLLLPLRSGTLSLSCTYEKQNYRNHTLTLTSSREILGANSITLHYTPRPTAYFYGSPSARRVTVSSAPFLSLTTDTDVFHLILDDLEDSRERVLDLKVGEYTGEVRVTQSGSISLHSKGPDFFIDADIQDAAISISSTWFGLEAAGNVDAMAINGYVSISPAKRHLFSLRLDEPNGLMTADFNAYTGASLHAVYQRGRLDLSWNGDTWNLVDEGNGVFRLLHKGAVAATLITESHATAPIFRLRLIPGENPDAPGWTLTMDFMAAALTLPADAVPVTPAAFLAQLEGIVCPNTDNGVLNQPPAAE